MLKTMNRVSVILMGLVWLAPCFIPAAGNNDQKELKKQGPKSIEKAELEKAASGDPTALRHVLDSLVFNRTSEYFDVVSAITIYKTALKNNPDIVNHAKIKPILFLIPVLDMAGQAGNLDVSALAAGFSFDSPFHGRTFYSDGHITSISAHHMHAACAYMAERASVSHDLGIQDPKLIFQLVFRFFIHFLCKTLDIPSWKSDQETAIKVITTYYKAWKSKTIIPFTPDEYMAPVFGERWIIPAIQAERKIRVRKTITQSMLDQIRYLSSDLHSLCQEAYQKALIFFNAQAFAENFECAGEGEIQAAIHQQTRGFYDDFCQKIKPIVEQGNTEWPFYTPEQQKISNPVQRHQLIKKQLDQAEKSMGKILKNIIDSRKKNSIPWVGSVSSLRTVQMRFLGFSNAVGLLYGQMYKNPEQKDSGAIIADQVRLYMVKQRTKQLQTFYQGMEKQIQISRANG